MVKGFRGCKSIRFVTQMGVVKLEKYQLYALTRMVLSEKIKNGGGVTSRSTSYFIALF